MESKPNVPDNLKSRLKDSYDAIAENYLDWKLLKNYAIPIEYLDKLLALLPKDSNEPVSVLELGCGAGVPVTEKLLSRSNFNITANDISTTQVAMGKERLGEDRITWIEGDMMSLSFPPGSLDVVLGFYSVIHLPRDEQVLMLDKAVSWLKPDGYILFNFAAEEMETRVKEGWMGGEGFMYWSGWGAEKTLQKVKDAGLEVVMGEVRGDAVDSDFLWVIARKPAA